MRSQQQNHLPPINQVNSKPWPATSPQKDSKYLPQKVKPFPAGFEKALNTTPWRSLIILQFANDLGYLEPSLVIFSDQHLIAHNYQNLSTMYSLFRHMIVISIYISTCIFHICTALPFYRGWNLDANKRKFWINYRISHPSTTKPILRRWVNNHV